MNDQMHKLNSLYQLLCYTQPRPAPEKYGVYAAAKTLVRELLLLTWKKEPADVHANFYSELLIPYIKKHL